MKRRLLLILSVAILCVLATSVTALGATTKGFDGQVYTHNPCFDNCVKAHGIDISAYQGTISKSTFIKMKAQGVDFVIIRCGFTYSSSKTMEKDKYFEGNYANAKAAGLSIGAYYYSAGTSVSYATKEAASALNYLSGKTLELPVAFDMEDKCQSSISVSTKAEMCKAFCQAIKDGGYDAVVYASLNWLNNKIGSIQPYTAWVAQWYDECNYKLPYMLWQYTSNGKLKGYDGRLDCDFYYITDKVASGTNPLASAEISLSYYTYTFIDSARRPAVTVTLNGQTLVKGVDYTTAYYNNYKAGTASVVVSGKGSYNGYKKIKNYTIKKQSFTGSTYNSAITKLSTSSYTYSGAEKKPTVTVVNSAGKTLVKNVDYTVSYKNNVKVGTATVTVTGKGNYTGILTKNYTIKKLASTISAYDTYNKSVGTAFSLGAKTNGDGPLKYSVSDSSFATVTSTGSVTMNSFGQTTIKILSPATANCYAAEKTVTVKALDLVKGLNWKLKAPTYFTLYWDKLKGAQKYRIYSVNVTTGARKYLASTSETSKVIKGLKPSTKYKYCIRAVDSDGNTGSYTASITVITRPTKIYSLHIDSRYSNSAMLDWNTQIGVTGYRVYKYDYSTEKYKWIKTIKGYQYSYYKLTGLTSATKYRYKVAAYYGEKRGEPTAISFVSRPLTETIYSTTTSKGKIKLTWKKVRSTGYQIRYSTSKSFSTYKNVTVTPGSTVAKTLSLTSGKTYYIKIRAYKTYDDTRHFGYWSDTVVKKCK